MIYSKRNELTGDRHLSAVGGRRGSALTVILDCPPEIIRGDGHMVRRVREA